MATHSSVLAWRILGTGEPGGLPSIGSHRVGHDWSDLAAAAAAAERNFRDTHRQQQEERANGAQLWVPETEDQELQYFWKLQWRFCQDGKDQGVITYQRDYMCGRQWASKTCELGLTYCEKCLSLGKGPRMYLIKNLHGQEKIKKKLKSVWLYKTLKIHFPPVNLCICIHTLIIL